MVKHLQSAVDDLLPSTGSPIEWQIEECDLNIYYY